MVLVDAVIVIYYCQSISRTTFGFDWEDGKHKRREKISGRRLAILVEKFILFWHLHFCGDDCIWYRFTIDRFLWDI